MTMNVLLRKHARHQEWHVKMLKLMIRWGKVLPQCARLKEWHTKFR